MVETVYDPLQYFLSDSKWDWRPLNDQIARDCDNLLGGHEDSGLYIDETGIPKKGKKSAGVARPPMVWTAWKSRQLPGHSFRDPRQGAFFGTD